MEEILGKVTQAWSRLPLWAKWAIGAAIVVVAYLLIKRAQKSMQAAQWLRRIEEVMSTPLDSDQKDSIAAIVAVFHQYGDGDTNKLAYILATARHESRFRAIKEYRANPLTQPSLYATQNRYWGSGYYGRGFVQLTWERNYSKMSAVVGEDLVTYPEKALAPPIAAKILVIGMLEGMFTRRRLDEFINGDTVDFYNARKVVNGLDRANRIAGFAFAYLGNMA